MLDDKAASIEPNLNDAFREAMRSAASSVYLLTARGEEGDVGMTATAACSLSFDPISVLVCVNRSASIARTLERTGRFVLNILSLDDQVIANDFGSPVGKKHRFSRGEWYELDQMPALRSSISSMSCEVSRSMEFGTHCIYASTVGRVDIRTGKSELLYCKGNFRALG
ncbi:MAG: hypothetical protein RLZZ84_1630 [Pseudomonadota bacterium]